MSRKDLIQLAIIWGLVLVLGTALYIAYSNWFNSGPARSKEVQNVKQT